MGLRETMTDEEWREWSQALVTFGMAHALIDRHVTNLLEIGMPHHLIDGALKFFGNLHQAVRYDDIRKAPCYTVIKGPEHDL